MPPFFLWLCGGGYRSIDDRRLFFLKSNKTPNSLSENKNQNIGSQKIIFRIFGSRGGTGCGYNIIL